MHDISHDTIIAAANGDMKAFEEIYNALSAFVYSVALRIVGNTTDAQDITQEVFVKLFHHLKAFEFRSSLKTWLYRITANTSLNARKRIKRQMHHRVDFEIVERTQPTDPANASALNKQDQEQLIASLLATLNPEQRACIVLREIQGLRYQEIAEALRININTVRSRLKRARHTLMAYAKKEVIHNEM